MQNKYAGDVGDFGKFGLLRHLSRERAIGVVWYLYSNEHNGDGGHVDYVNDQRYLICDPLLIRTLSRVIECKPRSVNQLEQACLIEKAQYHSELLSYASFSSRAFTRRGRSERLAHREAWLDRAIETVRGCDIVFLDPDNGLEVQSIARHALKGPKYVFRDEVNRFLDSESIRTVVLYHHLNRHGRHGTHERQLKDRNGELSVSTGGFVSSLRFHPYSSRAFFIVTRDRGEHEQTRKSLAEFVNGPWGEFFTLSPGSE